jgi:Zn-dependent protease
VPQFRLFGTPVRIEPIFLLLPVIFGLGLPTTLLVWWVVTVFVSVLLHEFGHAVAFRAFGQQPRIVLHGLGGTTYGDRPHRTRGQSIVTALAGPLTGIVLLGLPALSLREGGWAAESDFRQDVLMLVVWVNIVWSLVNLLPILPLDGGQVAAAVIGQRATMLCSVVIGFGGGLYLLLHGYPGGIFAVLLGALNMTNLQRLSAGSRGGRRPAVPPPSAGPFLRDGPAVGTGNDAPPGPAPTESAGWEALGSGDVASALRAVSALDTRPGTSAAFLRAGVVLRSGHAGEALPAFTDAYLARPTGSDSMLAAALVGDAGLAEPLTSRLLATGGERGVEAAVNLLHHLRYVSRNGAAAAVGRLLYVDGRASRAETAFDVACAVSRAGHPDEALLWLEHAWAAGFRSVALLDGEPDLEAVRALPAWPLFRARA